MSRNREETKDAKRIIGYGVSTRHATEKQMKNTLTIAMQELAFLGFDCTKKVDPKIATKYDCQREDILAGASVAVEVVRSGDGRKPLLEAIIKCLDYGDTIVLYSMDTLFKGQNIKSDGNSYFNGCYYYREILNKGINLLVFDFSGGTPRISEYSTMFRIPDDESVQDDESAQERIFKKFRSILEKALRMIPKIEIADEKDSFLTVVGKKIRENYVVETVGGTEEENRRARAFQAIYFAYESYMIANPGQKNKEKEEDKDKDKDKGMTLKLLEEYCGITTMLTFWRMAADFEKSIYYEDALKKFCDNFGYDIFEYPKRCGKLPQDLEDLAAKIWKTQSNFPDGSYSRDVVDKYIWEKGLLINTDIYHRWHLTTIGAKKPRKPPVSFDLKKFRQVYKF